MKKLISELNLNSVIEIEGVKYYLINKNLPLPGLNLIQSLDGTEVKNITSVCEVEVIAEVPDQVRIEFGRVVGCGLIALKQNEVLLGRRSDGQGYCIAGGKVKIGETYQEAAIREFKEEFGLVANSESTKFIGSICTNAYIRGELTDVISYIFWAPEYDGNINQNEEMVEIQWVPLDSAETKVSLFTPTKMALNLFKDYRRNNLGVEF